MTERFSADVHHWEGMKGARTCARRSAAGNESSNPARGRSAVTTIADVVSATSYHLCGMCVVRGAKGAIRGHWRQMPLRRVMSVFLHHLRHAVRRPESPQGTEGSSERPDCFCGSTLCPNVGPQRDCRVPLVSSLGLSFSVRTRLCVAMLGSWVLAQTHGVFANAFTYAPWNLRCGQPR